MNNQMHLNIPGVVESILVETTQIGFPMASEPLTGSLLRTLAASKPSGRFLELGTGTGVSAGWLLDGMDQNSRLVTVDNNQTVVSIAQKYLDDQRITFHVGDAGEFLEKLKEKDQQFDLIFADAFAGKYSHLEIALNALKPGGLYIVDDMLPQPNWPEGHETNVGALIANLEGRQDLLLTQLNCSSGIILVTKKS